MHQILKNIRALRELQQYSQEYVADQLGMTQSSYARFENEGKKIDFKVIEKIATILETPIPLMIDFHKNRYHDRAEEEQSNIQQRENQELLARVQHLEEKINLLQAQLKDKEQIIQLLKTN